MFKDRQAGVFEPKRSQDFDALGAGQTVSEHHLCGQDLCEQAVSDNVNVLLRASRQKLKSRLSASIQIIEILGILVPPRWIIKSIPKAFFERDIFRFTFGSAQREAGMPALCE